MRYLLLTFKNIGKFVRFHPVMFVLFLAVQIICCAAAFITCGMAYNMFYVSEKADEYMTYTLSFEQNAEELENMGEVSKDENGKPCWFPQTERTDANGEIYFVPDENAVPIYEIERKGVVPITEMKKKMPELLEYLGSYNVAKISLMVFPNKMMTPDSQSDDYFMTLYPDRKMKDKSIDDIYVFSSDRMIVFSDKRDTDLLGTVRQMNGFDYKYTAVKKGIDFIPFIALDDDFVVYLMYVQFEDRLTKADLDKLEPIFRAVFGEYMRESFPPEPYDPMEIQLNKMMYVISLAVMVIILLAIAKFYSYVLSERKEALAVLRLCGCTRLRAHIIYILEIFLTMAATSLAGFLMFRYVFFGGIAELYPSFSHFYNDTVYLLVLAVYMGLAIIIMTITIVPSTKANITEMKKKAK